MTTKKQKNIEIHKEPNNPIMIGMAFYPLLFSIMMFYLEWHPHTYIMLAISIAMFIIGIFPIREVVFP